MATFPQTFVVAATTSLKECLFSQYSEKEDKYEEEIKILSDKLKEVSLFWHFFVCLFLTALSYLICFFFFVCFCFLGWNSCWICWENSCQTGKVYWWSGRYEITPVLVFQIFNFKSDNKVLGVSNIFYWEMTEVFIRYIGEPAW